MFSLGKLALGREDYYLAQVARSGSRASTWDTVKHRGGQWLGQGAELRRVSGVVEGEQLKTVRRRRGPVIGTRLTAGHGGGKVAGVNRMFVPKSVSLVGGRNTTAKARRR